MLLFYRRLVAGTYDVRWNWAVLVAITFTAAYTLAFMLALIFNCNPTQAYWKAFDLSWIEHHKYTCADTTAINVLAGICAAASDLYVSGHNTGTCPVESNLGGFRSDTRSYSPSS